MAAPTGFLADVGLSVAPPVAFETLSLPAPGLVEAVVPLTFLSATGAYAANYALRASSSLFNS